jgi:hypothetical protein
MICKQQCIYRRRTGYRGHPMFNPSEFRSALRRQVEDGPWTWRSLAEALNTLGIDVAWQTVHTWATADRQPPPPPMVFALEDVLGCVNLLSGTLGYQRADNTCDVPRAISADPDLFPEQREDLLALWELMRMRAAERRRMR